MKRRNTFELEDQPWFPASFRASMMESLQTSLNLWGVYKPVVPLIKRLTMHMGTEQIVDLCSGGAGPWPQLIEAGWPQQVTLTDKYPNPEVLKHVQAQSNGRIRYLAEPVDATQVSPALPGVRTLFTAFHHFPPHLARAILQDAATQRRAIGVFEIVERKFLQIAGAALFTPAAMMMLPLSAKTMTVEKWFWTYVIPAIPVAGTWDAVASNVRAYSVADLHELTTSVYSNAYTWEVGQLTFPAAKIPVTYLLGYPTEGQGI